MPSRRLRRTLTANLARLLLLVGGATMLLPLAWMVVTSLKDDQTLRNYPTSWRLGLPRRSPAGALRLDALFFVTEDFTELDLTGFEQPEALTLRESGAAKAARSAVRAGADDLRAARSGQRALEFDYDFAAGPAGAVRIEFDQPQTFRALTGLNLWLYGDGSGHRLDLRLETDSGALVTSAPWEINFDGWHEVSCYFRENDRLGGMPLLVPAPAPSGAPAARPAPAFPAGQPISLAVRAFELKLTELPYGAALWNRVTYNYRRILDSVPLGRYFWNTLLVAYAVTFGTVATSALAAYAFARLKFPGRDLIFYAYLATMMIPADVITIPRFIMAQKLGLFDTFAAIIIPNIATPYGTFLLRQFFMTIPRDLEEAAIIDGCSRFGIFWRIILPLSKPALATLAVMSFIGAWNMFLWPLLVTSNPDNWVLQVGLAKMQANLFRNYNLMMAGALISLVPTIIIFTAAQRAFREGIVLSGMKE